MDNYTNKNYLTAKKDNYNKTHKTSTVPTTYIHINAPLNIILTNLKVISNLRDVEQFIRHFVTLITLLMINVIKQRQHIQTNEKVLIIDDLLAVGMANFCNFKMQIITNDIFKDFN